jgi:hypothetical protein
MARTVPPDAGTGQRLHRYVPWLQTESGDVSPTRGRTRWWSRELSHLQPRLRDAGFDPTGDYFGAARARPGSLSELFVRKLKLGPSVTDKKFACPDEQ